MGTNDLKKVLTDSEEILNQILNECQDGPPELVLLASKMQPLLADFSEKEAALFSLTSENSEETPSGSILSSQE